MAEGGNLMDAQEVLNCNICEENQIKWKCIQCNDLLCDECKNVHDKIKVSRHHTVIHLQEINTHHDLIGSALPKCNIHHNAENYMFCKQCDNQICPVCVTESHCYHDVETIVDTIIRKHADLTGHVLSLRNINSDLMNLKSSLSTKRDDYLDSISKIEMYIHKRKENVKETMATKIDNIADDLLRKVQDEKKSHGQEIFQKKESELQNDSHEIDKLIDEIECKIQEKMNLSVVNKEKEVRNVLTEHVKKDTNIDIKFPKVVEDKMTMDEIAQRLMGKIVWLSGSEMDQDSNSDDNSIVNASAEFYFFETDKGTVSLDGQDLNAEEKTCTADQPAQTDTEKQEVTQFSAKSQRSSKQKSKSIQTKVTTVSDETLQIVHSVFLNSGSTKSLVKTQDKITVWTATVGTKNIHQVMWNTANEKPVITSYGTRFKIYDMVVTPGAQIFLTAENGHTVETLSSSVIFRYMFKKVADLSPFTTHGLCETTSGHLLVCLQLGEIGKIIEITVTGKELRTFYYGEDNKSPLFRKPLRIKENIDGSIIVIQEETTNGNKNVIIIDKNSVHRQTYKGTMKTRNTFEPWYIETDHLMNILVSDFNNSVIHLLNCNGILLKVLHNSSVRNPCGISIDYNGKLWICSTGNKYLLHMDYNRGYQHQKSRVRTMSLPESM